MKSYQMMTIFAHPDDETFGIAGTMSRATASGHQVTVVCATRGEAGEIADPSLATPETLGQVREKELRNAMAAVGVTDVVFLDYIDGHLSEADHDEVVGRIVAQIRRVKPDVAITFAPNGVYGHRDHIAIHYFALDAIAAAADPLAYPELGAPHRVRKIYYSGVPREMLLAMRDRMKQEGKDFIPGGNEATIPVEEMGNPLSTITTIIRLNSDEIARKRNAMRAHATQMPPDSPFVSAPEEELIQRFGTETFILVEPPISDQPYPVPESDIFNNL
jgi:N-acetyl-1-D-myo-inositol-2-amino-2-deoxy-alpha-D-glucopyranoside deacetylase